MTQTSDNHLSSDANCSETNTSVEDSSVFLGTKSEIMNNPKEEAKASLSSSLDDFKKDQMSSKGTLKNNDNSEKSSLTAIGPKSDLERNAPIITPQTSSVEPDMETNSLTSSSFSVSKGVPTCVICPEPCMYFCKSCKKAGYCSKEHQKQHSRIHRPDCYPVIVQVNSLYGSHLVVTRDVRRGEVILREKPLIYAPFLLTPPIRKEKEKEGESSSDPDCLMCLSCHKMISSGSCSKCGWPVCSEQCEKNPTHAAQECRVFAESSISRSAVCDRLAQYLLVALVRILLEKEEDNHLHCPSSCSPSDYVDDDDAVDADHHDHVPGPKRSGNGKWTKFMEVVKRQLPLQHVNNSHLARSRCCSCSISSSTKLISKSLGPIISQRFSLTDAEIDQMVAALRTSSFITDCGKCSEREGYFINGWSSYTNNNFVPSSTGSTGSRFQGKKLLVYHLGSMLTSNCIPNCSWLIHNSLDLYLRASSPIKMGERLTVTYVDPLLPTWERRNRLWQEKFLSCACTRCTDPSESCTFFSAIKCPGKNEERSECEGYLLPTDPLAVAYWRWSSGMKEESHFCCFSNVDEDVKAEEADVEKKTKKIYDERVEDWKCNVCLMRQPWDFIRNKLDEMQNLFEQDVSFMTGDNNKLGENKDGENLEELESILTKIDNFVGKRSTHVNHFMLVRIELKLLEKISRQLEKSTGGSGIGVPFDQMERLALKMIEMCKKGLKVVNVLCPGLNRDRGRLLYFLQQALVINLLFKISKAMKIQNQQLQLSCKESSSLSHEELTKRFQEVLLARKEVHEIFAFTRGDEISEEKKMLKTVQHDSIEMRLLKKHFKYHQNNNTFINTNNCANSNVL